MNRRSLFQKLFGGFVAVAIGPKLSQKPVWSNTYRCTKNGLVRLTIEEAGRRHPVISDLSKWGTNSPAIHLNTFKGGTLQVSDPEMLEFLKSHPFCKK